MKKMIRTLLKRFGYDIHVSRPNMDPFVQLLAALQYTRIDLLFDIGANEGQFASGIQAAGFCGDVISFEPLSSARVKLLRLAERHNNWQVHPQAAVGDQDGTIKINISGNSVSSSVLPILGSHTSAAAKSAYIDSEEVQIIRLDAVAKEYLHEDPNLFLKIDTQGYEWHVLNGASETLKRAKGILCELSLVPLYEGQHLWRDVIDRLEAEGFTLWAIQKGFTDKRNGRSLQVDAIFLRLD